MECEGVVALRHGDRNTVNDNLFIGNGRRNTGGIRVVNAGHQIYDNVLVGLAGTRFFSALGVMDAVPNSLPNRYCQVVDVKMYRNTFCRLHEYRIWYRQGYGTYSCTGKSLIHG